MTFWLICFVLTCGVGAIVVRPLMRPAVGTYDNPDVAVYRAQLAEIERDITRDILTQDEAARARTEVARRLLAANKTGTTPIAKATANPVFSAVIVSAITVTSLGVYLQIGVPGATDLPLAARLADSEIMRATRPDQTALEAATPPAPAVDAPPEYQQAITQLRVIAPTRPDDLQAWELLAHHEAGLHNYAAAAAAQRNIMRIKGPDATIADSQTLLDMMVSAAGGYISPEAETVANDILTHAPQNIAARYYLGALYNQTDRPDVAYRLWRDIAETGDPLLFHVASARAQIADAAERAGINYTLPQISGPTAADVANAQNMTPDERAAMIGNMVAGLAERLTNEGGTAADWARLISAYGVLGDINAARAVWTEAAEVFGSNDDAMAILRPAATQAGAIE